MERIREVLKNYGITQKELAEKLGISPVSLHQRLKNPTLSSLKEIAENIPCNIHELIEAGNDHAHFYENGTWYGIRKK
ncbi:helix-turn-helix domain-containing protein [Ornithobacterium rhinotracheale]|uniref:helix-turn-helix domain-containing protein n=1 Tax=Ornithobacterium rhinotracheale TaxID=28251 RepID=UPI0016252681|nr:helix-turn-helix transcriptional regulator [Ornithobacterium rhinotracheale]UOH77880.1 helix-turn-helix domain-containing protein [Ornithobacterium rhinotracheale]